jgi:signal peptidase II
MAPQALRRSAALTALGVVVADEASKTSARLSLGRCLTPGCSAVRLGWLEFVRIQNDGSAFGLARGVSVWTVVALLGLAVALLVAKRVPSPAMGVAAGLVLGGGLGNVLDRLIVGSVTDFISIVGHLDFNLADVALAAGCLLMSWSLARTASDMPVAGGARVESKEASHDDTPRTDLTSV